MAGLVAYSVLFAGAMWLVLRGTEAEPIPEAGAFVLRYARGLLAFGAFSLLAGLVIVGWGAVAFGIESAEDLWSLVGLAVFFGGIGLAFVAAYRREWVRVTLDGIESQSLLASEPVRIAWSDVERVRFGRVSGLLTVIARDGRRARVSALMVGADHLGDLVEERYPRRGGPEAARALRAFRGGLRG